MQRLCVASQVKAHPSGERTPKRKCNARVVNATPHADVKKNTLISALYTSFFTSDPTPALVPLVATVSLHGSMHTGVQTRVWG